MLRGAARATEARSNKLVERKGGRSTAVSLRNLLSVVHSFAEIIFRRVKRAIYPTTSRLLDEL